MSTATDADVVAALRTQGVREVSTSTLDRALYAADASLHRVPPRVVVRPRHTDELSAVLAVAGETGVPVTMRGAGTSIAGNAVGPGIVVDCARHLTRIVELDAELDAETATATVEPGVVHATLQARATAAGWRFGPDPSTHTRCTVGGMVGNNACGSRALGYGRTSDNIEALDVVWGTGERAHLAGASSTGEVAARLADVVAGDLGRVRTQFGRFSRQVSGYALEHLLPERFAPERFVVGSEGTLALVERATVRLVRDAPVRRLVVLGYPSMVHAADAVPALLAVDGLVACEGLDRRIVALVRNAPALPRGQGWLFAEVTGDDEGQAAVRAAAVVALAGALEARVVADAATQAALWRIREDGAGLAARTLKRPALSGWEDAAVPPERLGEWLRDFDGLLREHGLDGVPYGHFGDGCVHVRIDFDFGDRDSGGDRGRAAYRRFLLDCATTLAGYGGSLSGEHGDGRARSELLPVMYDAGSLALFGAVKAAADPDALLNPGVLVDPDPLDAGLRPARPRVQLPVTLVDIAEGAHRCTGVGKCVAPHAPGVMCPSWQATREEKDSTRGRARVLQEALDAGGFLDGVRDDAVGEALDLCLGCKGCASDCPTGVDMAALKAEVLHQRHRGLLGALRRPRTHHTLGRLPHLLGSPLRGLAPLAGGAGPVGRLVRRTAGIDPERGMPELAPVPLRRRLPAGGQPDVWIWADTFTDHFASGAAEAAIELLAQVGLVARVLDVSACCGLTLVSTGQLGAAARQVDRTVAALAPYVTDGTPLLGLEPSCLATLRDDAVRLAADPAAARTVADATVTLAELLARHAYRPRSLTGMTVVVQPHCHAASVLGFEADEALLRATGADVVRLGGCCGLAGNFGMEAGHRDVSVAVAELQLLPALRANPQAVVLADGLSCRHQAADLGGVRPVHLAELLLG